MIKKKITTIKQLSTLGGNAVLKKYGKAHYKKMVAIRWKNARKSKGK